MLTVSGVRVEWKYQVKTNLDLDKERNSFIKKKKKSYCNRRKVVGVGVCVRGEGLLQYGEGTSSSPDMI